MNKSKAISLLLISSFMLSSTSCNSNKKEMIIDVVDKYAEAILNSDFDSLDDCLEHDHKFDDIVCGYVEHYMEKEEYVNAYETILNNMSYEIDSDSLEINIIRKEATIDIIYTITDYMSIYEDLGEGEDMHDYLEALEHSTNNIVYISQELQLSLVEGEWLIADSDYENILEVYEFYEDVANNVIFIPQFSLMSSDELANCLYNFRISPSDVFYISQGDVYLVMYDSNSLSVYYSDNSVNPEETYGSIINTVLDADYGEVDPHSYYDGNTGYACLVDNDSNVIWTIVYLQGDRILTVNNLSDDDSRLIAFLDYIGLPHP